MSIKKPESVAVVGAGLAGLSCAAKLVESGCSVTVFDAADDVGGRIRTDKVDGFLLDRGFQIYLDAYPESSGLLELDDLKLQCFEPGAIIREGESSHTLMDVYRRPSSLFAAVFQSNFPLRSKLLIGKLRSYLKGKSIGQIWSIREVSTTEDYLRDFGFDNRMIELFFRNFYGGIFLERELQTDSRMFEFTFKMFAEGYACLPGRGMQSIPEQIASRLPDGTVRLNQKVEAIEDGVLSLKNQERFEADIIVLATDGNSANQLHPEIPIPEWRSTSNLYFTAPVSPLSKKLIALNGNTECLINHLCVITDIAPEYSEDNRSLISVSLKTFSNLPDEDLVPKVESELKDWFGDQVDQWSHLRTCLLYTSPSPRDRG